MKYVTYFHSVNIDSKSSRINNCGLIDGSIFDAIN